MKRQMLFLFLAAVLLVNGAAFAGDARDHRGEQQPQYSGNELGPFVFCAREGERCQFRGTSDVAFGPQNGEYSYKRGVSNAIDCKREEFGFRITGPEQPNCFVRSGGTVRSNTTQGYDLETPGPGYTFCALQGQRCQFRGPAEVLYGPYCFTGVGWQAATCIFGPYWGKKSNISRGIDCKREAFDFWPDASNASFGRVACYVRTQALDTNLESMRGLAGKVQTPQVAGLTNEALTAQVVETLKRQLPALQPKIQVSAAAGVVTLAGAVPSAADKGSVESVVKSVPGVARVQNNLQVAVGLPGRLPRGDIQLQQQRPQR